MNDASETGNSQNFRILLSGTFSGMIDSWTEYLCLEHNSDGSITLTSRSHEILAEAGQYANEDGDRELPAAINGKTVSGIDGDYIVGERLLHPDGAAEVTIRPGQMELAEEWLGTRKWNTQVGFRDAWLQIRAAVLPMDPEPSSDFANLPGNAAVAASRGPGGRKRPREIVIRCDGYPRPGVRCFELAFVEWQTGGFSVYQRTANKSDPEPGSSRLIVRFSNRLNWRAVFRFVRNNELARVEGNVGSNIRVQGVEEWQRDVIVSGMLGRWTVNPLFGQLSDTDLKYLHRRLGGLLSEDARHVLSELAGAKCRRWLRGKSLADTARLVGEDTVGDPLLLVQKMHSYNADRAAESFIERYSCGAAVPPKAFLNLMDWHAGSSGSALTRSRLFALWLQMETKPRGGCLIGRMGMGLSEVPAIRWLLRGHAAEVFGIIMETNANALRSFVISFLKDARHPAGKFTASYRCHSFVEYAFGRPLHREWARLAVEIQNVALELGLDLPEDIKLPEMPFLDVPDGPSMLIMH